MTDGSNLARLKAAYQTWHDTSGRNQEQWLEILGDNMRIRSVGGENAGLEFAAPCNSKQDALRYFTALLDAWEMVQWTPEVFVDGGKQIAMFGKCAWKNRANGKKAEVAISHLWTFEEGGAVELVEVFDTARAAAAAQG
ncbi:MAG: nuclear transport factor 2 family protein [Pseudomonadota bacterium]